MAGREGTLGFPKTTSCNLKDQAKRTILRNVRSQGHVYVELRENGKKSIFFCTLCLAPCYSDSVLFDHLKGNLHNERLATAKVTLLRPNPWPFNDGVVFFSINPNENEDQTRSLESHENGNGSLAIVTYNGNLGQDSQVDDKDLDSENRAVLIPGVRVGREVTDIEVTEVGYGLISARFRDKNNAVSNDINRIWCEWLGKKTDENNDLFEVPEHEFAVVTFGYNDFNLGRLGLLDDVKALLGEGEGNNSNKRRRSLSDSEDVSSERSSNNGHYDSAGEDSSSASAASSLVLNQYDDHRLMDTRFISSKAIRRELRRKQRIAAERMCDICQHKMLPGKDVATLMNVKNGKLACSSRNGNGAFHLFHTSCLIHWVLLCEVEAIANQPEIPKVKRRSRRKTAPKCNEVHKETETKAIWTPINGVMCPECQGTGSFVEGGDEKPSVPISKMFKYKIKVSDARRAWMKSPEVLKNCSTGFHFPCPSGENIQETVKTLKLLHFYRAR